MQLLALKVLIRKKGTASAIVATALLIALVASVNCLVNNINQQTTVLTKLAAASETYLLTSKNSSALSDSRIDFTIVSDVKNNSYVKYAFSEAMVQAELEATGGSCWVTVRGVDDPAAYFRLHGASVNGSVCQNSSQINAGVVLAKSLSLNKGDLVNLTINGKTAQLTLTGLVQTNQQSDAELTLQLSALNNFTDNASVSYVEFAIKDPAQAHALENITQTLPLNTKITPTQQITAFAQNINSQTVAFITLWSVAVYVVVAGASYVIAARTVNEAEYELGMIRTLGAKKNVTSRLVLVYALLIGFAGSLVGVSVGVVGAQATSTLVRWIWGSSLLAPFLEVDQALWVLLFAFAASFVGSFYPALKGRFSVLEAAT
jgi:ABC-type lipoprotein release transport system permease subunit